MEQNSPETDLQKYSQLTFDKRASQYCGVIIIFQPLVLEWLDIYMQKQSSHTLVFTPFTKLKSKQI